MIICPHCKVGKPGKVTSQGKSRVMETRIKSARIIFKGNRTRAWSVIRLRQCTKCKWRWKTVEVPYVPTRNRSQP